MITEVYLNQIPVEPACSTCIGACCMKGNGLELSPEEADYLAGQGTELEQVPKGEIPRAERRAIARNNDIYVLKSDCGNLDPDTRQCTDYENRPQICRDFKASGKSGSPCAYKREEMGKRVARGIAFIPLSAIGRYETMTKSDRRTTTLS